MTEAVKKLNIVVDEVKFLRAVDGEGDHEIGAGSDSILDKLREAGLHKTGERIIEQDEEINILRARVAELEEALRPLACTCAAKHQVECSRSEKDCPFWAARAALAKTGESE